MPTQNTISWDILALYDAVMAEIEPDLTRAGLETLNEKYKDETPEQKEARAERYAAAYAEWKVRLGKIVALWKKEVMKYRDGLISNAKIQSAKKDEDELTDIAPTIASL